jgi:hypothetical protein
VDVAVAMGMLRCVMRTLETLEKATEVDFLSKQAVAFD